MAPRTIIDDHGGDRHGSAGNSNCKLGPAAVLLQLLSIAATALVLTEVFPSCILRPAPTPSACSFFILGDAVAGAVNQAWSLSHAVAGRERGSAEKLSPRRIHKKLTTLSYARWHRRSTTASGNSGPALAGTPIVRRLQTKHIHASLSTEQPFLPPQHAFWLVCTAFARCRHSLACACGVARLRSLPPALPPASSEKPWPAPAPAHTPLPPLAQTDCTNCSGPLDPVQGRVAGVRSTGYGDEVFVKHIADHMHTVKYKMASGAPDKTLHELGFRYVNMDASWDTANRSANGSLVPDPKLWPSGLDHTVEYVHSLGAVSGVRAPPLGPLPGVGLLAARNALHAHARLRCTRQTGSPSLCTVGPHVSKKRGGAGAACCCHRCNSFAGMGFGLYGDRGPLDCAKHPGQFGHEAQDGAWLGAHKIDWFKEDACFAPDRKLKNQTEGELEAIALYGKLRDALNKSGHPVWFALCGWEPFFAEERLGGGKRLANSARIGPDTGGGWTAVMQNIENALPVQPDAGPTAGGGFWNDGSMQLTPGWSCHGPGDGAHAQVPSDPCVTNTRFTSMYSLWNIMAFNLLLVGDFAKLNPFVMGTWTNDRAIAINQDVLGIPAVRVDGGSGGHGALVSQGLAGAAATATASQMRVAECGGEPQQQEWTFSGGFVSNAASKTCLDVASCQTWITYVLRRLQTMHLACVDMIRAVLGFCLHPAASSLSLAERWGALGSGVQLQFHFHHDNYHH